MSDTPQCLCERCACAQRTALGICPACRDGQHAGRQAGETIAPPPRSGVAVAPPIRESLPEGRGPTPNTATPTPQKIHVGNLPASASEAEVRALFQPHGAIVTFHRPLAGPKQAPGSLAYLSMAPADATNAVQALHGLKLGGQILSVSEAARRRQRT